VNVDQRVKVMEEELKILKNEMQTVLLDIREQYLNLQNPFNTVALLEAKEQASAAIDELRNAKDQVEKSKSSLGSSTGKEETAKECVPAAAASPAVKMAPEIPTVNSASGDVNPISPVVPSRQTNNLQAAEAPRPEAPPRRNLPGLPPGGLNLEKPCESLLDETAPVKSDSDKRPKERTRTKGEPADSEKTGGEKAKSLQPPKTSDRYELVMVAGLAQWVENATKKLGKDRVEALVEVSNSMGRLPDHFRDLIVRLARLSSYPNESSMVITAHDYLVLLTQLEDLVGETLPHERALLSLLSNNGGSSWTR
jgi:hypothetical protein